MVHLNWTAPEADNLYGSASNFEASIHKPADNLFVRGATSCGVLDQLREQVRHAAEAAGWHLHSTEVNFYLRNIVIQKNGMQVVLQVSYITLLSVRLTIHFLRSYMRAVRISEATRKRYTLRSSKI